MRVALVVFGELTDRSGGFRYDYYLAKALRRRGHTVSVVSQREDVPYRLQPRYLASGAWIDEVVSTNPDIVLIDELNHAATSEGIEPLRRRLGNVPIVAIIHHLRSDETRWGIAALSRSRRLERRFLRRCDAWLCNSTVTLQRVRRVTTVRRSSAVVFPSAYSDEAPAASDGAPAFDGGPAEKSSTANGAFRVLFVGNVTPRKNVAALIAAVARLARRTARSGKPQTERPASIHLDIVGDLAGAPRYAARLRRYVESCCGAVDSLNHPRVVFHDRIGEAALAELYRSADVLALPSVYEGFGIVYLEALRRGVPVIATRRGGASEIVTNPDVGRLVAPRSGSIFRGLTELFQLRTERDTGGTKTQCEDWNDNVVDAARRRADAFPSWEVGMTGAVRFLESLTTALPAAEGE